MSRWGVVAGSPHVCLVVPNGTHRPQGLAQAIANLHPDVQIGAIWCGDPQLRPACDDVVWWDTDVVRGDETVQDAWHQCLLRSTPLDAEWRGALDVSLALLSRGATSVTVLWVGAIAVLDDISALWAGASPLTLVPRITSMLPDDGAMPDELTLAVDGAFCPHVATFGLASAAAIEWLLRRLDHDVAPLDDGGEAAPRVARRAGVSRWLELAATTFDAHRCTDERIGVGAWRWQTDRPSLLDLPGYDPETPWVLDQRLSERGRVSIVGHDDRRASIAAAAPQLAGKRLPLVGPGGIVLDDIIRRLARRSAGATPSPWNRPAQFRSWLADGYWTELHASRRDLAIAFPRPTTDDEPAFRSWSRRAVVDDTVSLMVPPVQVGRATSTRYETLAELRTDGLNLAGYLRRESSLGDVARRMAEALTAAAVPMSTLAHERTGSPLLERPPSTDQRIEFATTLAIVNADQFVLLEADHPELIAATRRMIGYWFWELEHIPQGMRAIFPMVNEIWAGSTFVANAFAAVTQMPVRYVPIPISRPVTSGAERSAFAPLAHFGGRFVFAVVFDHFSVTERKNPVGAIEAFRRAFAPDEGPVLVVKSMNGDQRWPQHQQVVAAAEGRPDIVVWDVHLSRDDHMAFIAAVDVLVSLHRSEGLGLHLAEAMWLDTPTIATRYSGNLDFMDDDCSLLVDATLVHVRGGQGVYPPEALWADPDLDVAAAAMRRLAGDAGLCATLAAAGRSKMEAQPTPAQTGRLIAELLQLEEN